MLGISEYTQHSDCSRMENEHAQKSHQTFDDNSTSFHRHKNVICPIYLRAMSLEYLKHPPVIEAI